MKKFFCLTVIVLSTLQFPGYPQTGLSAKELYLEMMESLHKLNGSGFVLDLHERIKGEMMHDRFILKVNEKPFKVYVYSLTPNPGAEALLVEGTNDNKAVINANRWYVPTLHLSPYHTILRKNHQFTLWQFGFGYVRKILKGYESRFGDSFYKFLYREADEEWNGKNYYKLVIDYPDFTFTDYQIQAGENLPAIADKLLLNDYMILEANKDVRNFDDVKPGQVIKIPNVFGKKIIFLIDKNTFVPVVQQVYDDKGLFTKIEISSLVINPDFPTNTFSKDNEDYGF